MNPQDQVSPRAPDTESEYPVFTAHTVNRKTEGWGTITVGVFQWDSADATPSLLGTYDRNYSTNFDNFAPTRKGDRYFALYSRQYTATRVMEIFPGKRFEDIGGEEESGDGFCPTGLYIPTVRQYVSEQHHVGRPNDRIKDWSRLLDYFPPGSRTVEMSRSRGRRKLAWPDGKDIRAYTGKMRTIGPSYPDREEYKWVWGPEADYEHGYVVLPPKHGFVAGCYWGDDSSWKIQYLDVSRIDEGIIARDERFGYIELPSNLTLQKAISFEDHEGGSRIKMAIDLTFDIDTGKAYDDVGSFSARLAAGHAELEEERAVDSATERQQQTKELEVELKRRWEEQGAQILAAGGHL